jgi:phosphatidate cytidylyltransferase
MEKRRVDKLHSQRWLTAAVAIPVLVLIVGFGPSWLVLILILLVTAGGLLELFGLLYTETTPWFRATAVGIGLALPLASHLKGALGLSGATIGVLFISLSLHLLLYARKEADTQALGKLVFAQLYIPFALSHIVLLFQLPDGRRWIFLVLLVVFAGDTGAYYSGHRWGKHRLIPAVSPGKTVEGAVGGLLSSLILTLLAGLVLLSSSEVSVGFLFVLGLVLAMVSQMGDLMESMLKRLSQVKDASGLLPGHGGLLDRLDSLIFAFPITYYAAVFFA